MNKFIVQDSFLLFVYIIIIIIIIIIVVVVVIIIIMQWIWIRETCAGGWGKHQSLTENLAVCGSLRDSQLSFLF